MNLERLRVLKDVADRPTNGHEELDWKTCLAARAARKFGLAVSPVPDFGDILDIAGSFARFFRISPQEGRNLCCGASIAEKRIVLNAIVKRAEAEATAAAAKAAAAKTKARRAAAVAKLAALTKPAAKARPLSTASKAEEAALSRVARKTGRAAKRALIRA